MTDGVTDETFIFNELNCTEHVQLIQTSSAVFLSQNFAIQLSDKVHLEESSIILL